MTHDHPQIIIRRAFAVAIIATLFLSACKQLSSKGTAETPATTPIADEVSLKADRSKLAEMRQEVPAEVQRENDELAFIRDLLAQGEQEPSKVRERFNKAVRDRRERFDKAAHKRREEFNRKEKSAREDYLKKQKEKREEFVNSRAASKADKRKAFFDEQETQRSQYFGNERDARKDFESQETEARRTFEAYLTEKTNQFNAEMRDYTSNYYDRRKNLDLKKRADERAKEKAKQEAREKNKEATREQTLESLRKDENASPHAGDPDLEQFKSIPNTPATPLVPPEDK